MVFTFFADLRQRCFQTIFPTRVANMQYEQELRLVLFLLCESMSLLMVCNVCFHDVPSTIMYVVRLCLSTVNVAKKCPPVKSYSLQGLIDSSVREYYLTPEPQHASITSFNVGDQVRVKPNVWNPLFGWGDVSSSVR